MKRKPRKPVPMIKAVSALLPHSPHYTVHVPESGFLAVVLKGSVSNEVAMKLQNVICEKSGMKCIVFIGEFQFVGVGPEPKKAK